MLLGGLVGGESSVCWMCFMFSCCWLFTWCLICSFEIQMCWYRVRLRPQHAMCLLAGMHMKRDCRIEALFYFLELHTVNMS